MVELGPVTVDHEEPYISSESVIDLSEDLSDIDDAGYDQLLAEYHDRGAPGIHELLSHEPRRHPRTPFPILFISEAKMDREMVYLRSRDPPNPKEPEHPVYLQKDYPKKYKKLHHQKKKRINYDSAPLCNGCQDVKRVDNGIFIGTSKNICPHKHPFETYESFTLRAGHPIHKPLTLRISEEALDDGTLLTILKNAKKVCTTLTIIKKQIIYL